MIFSVIDQSSSNIIYTMSSNKECEFKHAYICMPTKGILGIKLIGIIGSSTNS